MPPKTAPTTAPAQKGKANNVDDIVIPRWIKPEAMIWVENYDTAGLAIVGYAQAVVTSVMNEKKMVAVSYLAGYDGPAEVIVTKVLERAEVPQLNDDLVDIEPLNDAEILRCLEYRLKSNLIYCFCGPSMLSTNPFIELPYPDKEQDWQIYRKFALSGGKRIPKPHIWNLAAIVFNQLLESGKDQAICISGESGSGKSHSTRMCLSFITQLFSDKAASGEVTIEDRIMSCNPIIESFGNSKTIRNKDSSRFGKYFLLFIDMKSKQIRGAKIENYLLEKSRVITQAVNERNYHIFYALLKAMEPEKQQKYLLSDSGRADMASYPILAKSGCFSHPDINDEAIFAKVCQSFNNLGFAAEEQDAIWKIMSVVLNLSNVKIDESTYKESSAPCSVQKGKALDRVLKLLNVDQVTFTGGICVKKIQSVNDTITTVLTPTECEGVKDALAKDLFNSMFNWMVIKLNVSLIPESKQTFASAGLLDIFGFEDFEINNSLEQLCINYTNEKLQKLYIFCVFTAERKIFEEESLGQHSDKIKTNENTEVLKLFESQAAPPGIFQLIDSACKMSKENTKAEENLKSDILRNHEKHPLMSFDKLKTQLFSIKHTAKRVTYNANNIPEKNRDELPTNLYDMMALGDPIINRIFRMRLTDDQAPEVKSAKDQNKKTLVSKFKQDIDGLMTKLENSTCNFIRCLKPNDPQIPGQWDNLYFLTQIKYMGILDSIKVRRESFPLRRLYKDFYSKYQDLDTISPERNTSFIKLSAKPSVDWKTLCQNVVKSVESKTPANQQLFGKTRIFMNIVYVNKLEELLEDKQKHSRVLLNKLILTYQAYDFTLLWGKYRKASLKVVGLAKTLLNTWNSKIEYVKFKNTLRVTLTMQHRFRLVKYRRNQRLLKFSAEVIGRSFSKLKMRQNLINARRRLQLIARVATIIKFRLFMVRLRINKQAMEVIFERAWLIIKDRIKIQSCETIERIWRGYLNRKDKLEDVKKLNTAREAIIQNRACKTVSRIARGFIVRSRLNRMHRAAGFIQGYTRMLLLSKYFGLVKESARKIQRIARKYILRNRVINHRMAVFSKKHPEFIQQIKTIEHDVIFKQGDSFYNLKNLENYTRVKFFQDKKDFREYIPKIDGFVPPNPTIDLNPKMRLFSVLIDFDCMADTSDVYKRSWAVDYLNYQNTLRQKGARMLHLEVGDTFTMGVDDDLKIYSWGANDQMQLGRSYRTNESNAFPTACKRLGNLFPRMISSGDNHTLMVDYSNDLYVWGANTEGQYGLGHPRDVGSIVHLKTSGNKAQSIASKGNRNYFIRNDGKLFTWPNPSVPEKMYIPMHAPIMDKEIKFAHVACGRIFTIALATNGILFGWGSNKFGQLGTGDTEDRQIFTPIETLYKYGEKISEVSCGFAHVICKTTTDKVFAWGMGSKGQLGNNSTQHASVPYYVKVHDPTSLAKARSVQAGPLCSYVLLENKKVFYTGQILKSEDSEKELTSTFTNFEFEKKVFGGKLGMDFHPLRIYCKWSKLISVTYLMVADFRRVQNTTGIRDKIADQVHSKWEEVYAQVLPPFTEAIYKNICPKYIRKIPKVQEKDATESNTSYSKVLPDDLDRTKSKSVSRAAGTVNKENKSGVSPTRGGQSYHNPYNMKDPRFDKSYENLNSMSKRLKELVTMDESQWTADDRKLIQSLNKM